MRVSRKNWVRVAAGAISILPGMVTTVEAAQPATAQERAVSRFDIPAGPLSAALGKFAELTGIQLVYGSALTERLSTAGLKGEYTPQEGLSILLAGTGLTARMLSASSATIQKASPDGARTLGPVRVEGAAARVAGVNGSADATATEGTGSYTTGATTVGSKALQSIKDTPQSVSVITSRQMEDQRLNDLESVLRQSPGITMSIGTDGPLEARFFSRGFPVNRLQIDGGAPLEIGGGTGNSRLLPQIDMAMYDHVELLRGADGLFNGYGEPSGVVNLVRKRPLDRAQVIIEGTTGSWSNNRAVIDATGPLAFDGKVRGRAVIAWQDQDFFYAVASKERTTGYVVLEGDVSATTTLSAGGSVTRQDAIPWMYGLPRYENGDDLRLPRGTCLCFPWNSYEVDTEEVFARLDQSLGDDLAVKINLTRVEQENKYKRAYVQGTVNPVSGAGPRMLGSGGRGNRASTQNMADASFRGGFDLLGHRHTFVVGGNYFKADGGGLTTYQSLNTGNVPVSIFDFNPASPAFPEPATALPSNYFPVAANEQWGAYASLRYTLWSPLHVVTGLRHSSFDYEAVTQSLCTETTSAACAGRRIGDVRQTTSKRYSTDDFSWPPSVSLIYDVADPVSIYASYTDIYQDQSESVDQSGSSVDPITGSNVEVGVKWSGRGGRLNATLAVYQLKQENFARLRGRGEYEATNGFLPDGIHRCCYDNDADRVYFSEGMDLELTGEVLQGLQVSASYTYNTNEYQGRDNVVDGMPLVTQAPHHLMKLWGSYDFREEGWLRGLSVSAGTNAQSRSYNAGTACVAFITNAAGNLVCAPNSNVPYDYVQGAYAIFSARAAYALNPSWNVSLNISNLTDRTYYINTGTSSSGNWYGEPRSFMLALRGSF